MMMGADDGEEDDFIESTSESGDSARHVTCVENKESGPNTNTGYQPNIKSYPNIDILRISNLSGI